MAEKSEGEVLTVLNIASHSFRGQRREEGRKIQTFITNEEV